MRIGAFVLLVLVDLALSGPARRDCGQQKCFDAVNDCGMKYGGCWTECADGLKEMPTFTAPLCSSSTDNGYPTKGPGTVIDVPSSTGSSAESLITPPPTLDTSISLGSRTTKTCSALWLCVDHTAVCGDTIQMYGGCYDVCTSSPPVTSPPCSLSSSTYEASDATFTPSPEPGAAYTEKPATDSVTPAIEDSKALVMAEMPSSSSPTPEPPAAATAVEFRLANVNADEPVQTPEAETPALVEAPANMRGAAIAKMMADKVRKPNTDNVPCWDKDTCKEVQLGIPSPSPSSVESSTESPTAPSAEPTSNAPADAPADAPAEPPADPPADTVSDVPASAPTEVPA